MWQQVAFAVLLVIATFDNFDAFPSDYYSPLQEAIPYDEYRNPFSADKQSVDHAFLGGPLKRMQAHRYSRTLNSLVLGGGFKRSGQKSLGIEKQNPELEESYSNKSNGDERLNDIDAYRSAVYYLYKNMSPPSYQNM